MVYIDWRQDVLLEMKEIIYSNNTVDISQDKPCIDIMKQQPRMFYLLVTVCMLMYGGILPFNYIATSFLMKSWYDNFN
jgi:hypothetical protein